MQGNKDWLDEIYLKRRFSLIDCTSRGISVPNVKQCHVTGRMDSLFIDLEV